jgi:hypothetical protein
MCDSRLRTLGKTDRDTVSSSHSALAPKVSELIGSPLKLIEGVRRLFAVMVFVYEREPPRTIGPFVARIESDIEVVRHVPCERGWRWNIFD